MSWIKKCYSRLLIDNHITDLDPAYMTKFDPAEYVRMAKLAKVESAMVYACDHNGNCYYPAKTGHVHSNIGNRNIFGETVSGLRAAGITPIAYYSVVYHNDCARRFPHAEIIDAAGNNRDGRFHFSCPGYPETEAFYQQQITEILQHDVDGIFIDMSFWPLVCRCPKCQENFGRKLPDVIDWSDPVWVQFQRFREKTMADFAMRITGFCRKQKPGVTVTHQFSPVLHGWLLGQSSGIALASDYASGDFYGEKQQQRFGTKVFDAFSQIKPFEFMTSRCVDLHDHTSGKSEEELTLSACTSLANGGAYFFIDAINPDGTLEESFYRTLGSINTRLAPVRETIKNEEMHLKTEVALYFSMASCVDRHLDGKAVADLRDGGANNMEIRKNAVMDETMGAAEFLTRMHIPFEVITDTVSDISRFKAIIICNAAFLSEAEVSRLRDFTAAGGTLIATCETSLFTPDGRTTGNFALADVLGVDALGKRSDKINYTGKDKVISVEPAALAAAREGTEVLEKLFFPDFPARDPERYASIHSDPPGAESIYPAVTRHAYGKGLAVWIAAPFMILRHANHRNFAKKIFGEYLPHFTAAGTSLAESAELTLLESADRKSGIVAIVNAQNETPVIPLYEVELALNISRKVEKILNAATQQSVPFTQNDGILKFAPGKVHLAEYYQLFYQL